MTRDDILLIALLFFTFVLAIGAPIYVALGDERKRRHEEMLQAAEREEIRRVKLSAVLGANTPLNIRD